MDSTPVQTPPPPPTLPVATTSSKSKLPIKRKTPDFSSSTPISDPDPNFNHNPNFISPTTVPAFSDDHSAVAHAGPKPSPFKFHRIWTEPDEIRFLRGLLDSASDGLCFPRDLHIFYDRFSTAMSQPYTKSQLSEKLRRLRKKFRVISARLARGLDSTMISPHDRALFDLSKKLWSPELASISPFGGNFNYGITTSSGKSKIGNESIRVGVTNPIQKENVETVGINLDGYGNRDDHNNGPLNYKQKFDVGKLGGIAAKAIFDVFDESLKEAKMDVLWQELQAVSASSREGNLMDFGKRWGEQRALELDVFARRLRLVLENSLHQQ